MPYIILLADFLFNNYYRVNKKQEDTSIMARVVKKTVSSAKTEAMMIASFLQAIAGEECFFKQKHEMKLYIEGRLTDETVIISTDSKKVLDFIKEQFDDLMYKKFNRHVHMDGMKIYVKPVEAFDSNIA